MVDAYGGNSLKVVRRCFLDCKFANREKNEIRIYCSRKRKKVPTLVGFPTLKKLNLIKRVHNIGKYESTI